MRTINNTTKNPTNNIAFITQVLSRFSDKREGLVLVYLLTVADEGWMVETSVNAMAAQLNMHRQTLTRFINRLCEKGYAVWEATAGSRHPNLLHITPLVTDDVTDCVTEM